MEMSSEHRKGIAEGIGVMAVTIAQMDGTEADVWAKVLQMMVQLRIDETDGEGLVREAAESIAGLPQPPNDSPEQLERGRRIREMFGLPEPADELASYLRGREWLESLANKLADLAD